MKLKELKSIINPNTMVKIRSISTPNSYIETSSFGMMMSKVTRAVLNAEVDEIKPDTKEKEVMIIWIK